MAVNENLKKLVDQMPDPDSRRMFTKDMDKEKIERAVAEIFKGGAVNFQGLIDILGVPGSAENVKPHYALHCVLNHALIVKDEKARKTFCEILANALGGDYPDYTKAYFCQELQWAGRDEALAALGRTLESDTLCDPAAMALVTIGGDGAADQLRRALPGAEGARRLTIIHSLAALADPKAAGDLEKALGDDDLEVRIAAGTGLAAIGDARAVSALLKAADGKSGWERIQACKNCFVLAENLVESGKASDAKKLYEAIAKWNGPQEQHLKEIAQKALASA